jgi:hypothetical protein
VESTAVTYRLLAGGHTLTAWSLQELAELVDCALQAGDPVERLRALDRRPRPLTRFELERLVTLLADAGR